MPTIDVQLRRFSVVSVRPFEEVMARLTSTIGRPDMNTFHRPILKQHERDLRRLGSPRAGHDQARR
jgi:hypothetical protein